jgi:hypothetical protein
MTAQRAAVDDEMQSLLSRKLLRITDSAGIMRRELAAVASHGQLIAGSMRIGAEGSDAATERGTSEGTSGGSSRADGTVAEIVRLLGLCDAELEKVSDAPLVPYPRPLKLARAQAHPRTKPRLCTPTANLNTGCMRIPTTPAKLSPELLQPNLAADRVPSSGEAFAFLRRRSHFHRPRPLGRSRP